MVLEMRMLVSEEGLSVMVSKGGTVCVGRLYFGGHCWIERLGACM